MRPSRNWEAEEVVVARLPPEDSSRFFLVTAHSRVELDRRTNLVVASAQVRVPASRLCSIPVVPMHLVCSSSRCRYDFLLA